MIQIPYELALNILDNINGLTVVDENGKYLYLTKRMAEQLGTTQEEAIGQPAANFVRNPRLQNLFETKTSQWGKFNHTIARHGPGLPPSVVNRVLIYPDGNFDNPPVGAMSYTAMAYAPYTTSEPTEIFLKEFEQLQQQVELLRSHLGEVYHVDFDIEEILGESQRVQNVKKLIHRVAGTSATVCVLGETGTGKELVANSLHKLSDRKDKPFVKINCAAIPKDLLESELFGYEAGSFTGASRQGKIGKFELANGGTLLLDEIGELPLNLQAKLLRVLQSGEVERIGGTTPVPIDVRFICSTNRNLHKMVMEGTFRADLYYRINVIEIEVPPLRERLEDIPLLADHFIRSANERHDLNVSGAVPMVYQLLKRYNWPGNIRQLENCIERACILYGTGPLLPSHFDFLPVEPLPNEQVEADSSVKDLLNATEREMILQALNTCRGNKTMAAEMLRISRSTMYEKLKKHHIDL